MYYLKCTPVDKLISSILTPTEISINFRSFLTSTLNTHFTYIGYYDKLTTHVHDLLYQFCNYCVNTILSC